MKRSCIIAIISAVSTSAFGQPARSTFETSIAGEDRMALVKNSIHLTAWHEKPFWKLYENYAAKKDEAPLTYATVDDLAKTDKTVSDEVALENGQKLLAFRNEEIAVWKQYYMEVGAAHNGVIALQFLQTEALLDIMQSSNIYEGTPQRNFYFHPKALASTQSSQAKYATMTKALTIAPEESEAFFAIYAKYEAECTDMLGENYNMFELFVGDPSDYTPALAKTMGNNLLMVMKREIKLKEKYFAEMNTAMGPSFAARFLAWEDYYSSVSKMYVWNDAP